MDLNWYRKVAGVALHESGVYSGKRGVDYEVIYEDPTCIVYQPLTLAGLRLIGSDSWDILKDTDDTWKDQIKTLAVAHVRQGWNRMLHRFLIAPGMMGIKAGWDERNHEVQTADILPVGATSALHAAKAAGKFAMKQNKDVDYTF